MEMGDNKISDAIDRLAQVIREVDGNHSLGAGALAEAIIAKFPHLQGEAVPVAWLIDWPDEPDLGHYFAEEPSINARSQPLYTHPQPAALNEVSGTSGELVSDIYKVASTPGMTPIDLADWIRDVLLRNIYDLAATGKQPLQVGEAQGVNLSTIATRKLSELAAQGYVANGVAIFNPATGQRGLVDNLGYVGWQGIDLGRDVPPGMVVVQIADAERLCSIGESFGQHFDMLPVKRVRALIDGRDAGTGVGDIQPPRDLRTKLGEG
jgi:hypothetical protein